MYQILDYALKDPSNKTRFTLIFANVTEKDILLKEQFDALAKQHPDTLNVVYTLDKPEQGWAGAVGYVSQQMVEKYLPKAALGEKAKIFVCGPPGQVAAVAGKKDGMKQGALSGILKDLGYSEDQVRAVVLVGRVRECSLDLVGCGRSSSSECGACCCLCAVNRHMLMLSRVTLARANPCRA